MGKVADALRERGIYNPNGILLEWGDQGKDIAIEYHGEGPGLQSRTTLVWSPTFDTDPDAHWSNYKKKAFFGKMSEAMPKALAWAEEQYGITEWENCPFHPRTSKLPAYVVKRMKEALGL